MRSYKAQRVRDLIEARRCDNLRMHVHDEVEYIDGRCIEYERVNVYAGQLNLGGFFNREEAQRFIDRCRRIREMRIPERIAQ